jgi:hypothetical protein
MAGFEAFKDITPEEALLLAIQEIPYFEVVDNITHLPNKNDFKMKLLALLAKEGKVLLDKEGDNDVFESVYNNWHEEMIKEFNPESSATIEEAERHQTHIDPHESGWRDIA